MRWRLKASGSTASPKTALEHLRRLQQHRVKIGTQHLTGIGKISPIQSRSEEHMSELQSLLRISNDVFCLKTQITKYLQLTTTTTTPYNTTQLHTTPSSQTPT